MSRRGVIVLLIALLVLATLVFVGQRARAPAPAASGAILPALADALNDIERVTIVKAGGEAAATLERRPDRWIVVERDGYAADTTKLRQNLRALSEAKILEAKTSNPALYAKLGVADVTAADASGVAVSFSAAGKELPTLILGDAEGTKHRYVRRAGEAQSYLIDRDPEFPKTAAQWLDPLILDVRGPRVRQVTIKHPDGDTVMVSKTDTSQANYDVAAIPKGRELLYPGVANVIGNALRELHLEDVQRATAPPAGDQPIEFEFQTFDGLVVRGAGVKANNEAWVTFTAAFDPELALPAATPSPPADRAAAAGATDEPSAKPPADQPTSEDPKAEADRINQRVGGWRYKIATFQFDQMTRRMADLLKPPAEPQPKAKSKTSP
jgi:hypothetical protein